MKVNDLKVSKLKSPKRLGRGIAAGKGKTAGRGTKGQKSRAGSTKRPGFAGGQNPLMQQLPKLPGFKSYRSKAAVVFTDQINSLKDTTITPETLIKEGIIDNPYQKIKLLNRGEVKKPFKVMLPSASSAAINQIESAGGTFTKIAILARPLKPKDKK
jgi:large subunit ribosomal protein L15